MKLSYKMRWSPDGTVYTQCISMTQEQFKHLVLAFVAEIARDLPRKKEYINTNGYEIFMNVPEDTNIERGRIVYLNNTQTRFANLFTKLPLKDRNTCILIK